MNRATESYGIPSSIQPTCNESFKGTEREKRTEKIFEEIMVKTY